MKCPGECAVELRPFELPDTADPEQLGFAQTGPGEGDQRERVAHELRPVILLGAQQYPLEKLVGVRSVEVTVDSPVELFVDAEAHQLVEQRAEYQRIAHHGRRDDPVGLPGRQRLAVLPEMVVDEFPTLRLVERTDGMVGISPAAEHRGRGVVFPRREEYFDSCGSLGQPVEQFGISLVGELVDAVEYEQQRFAASGLRQQLLKALFGVPLAVSVVFDGIEIADFGVQPAEDAPVVAFGSGVPDEMVDDVAGGVLADAVDPVGDQRAFAHAALSRDEKLAAVVVQKCIEGLEIFFVADIGSAAASEESRCARRSASNGESSPCGKSRSSNSSKAASTCRPSCSGSPYSAWG